MTRWPLLCALLLDPVGESRRLIRALSAMPAGRRVHRIRDERGDGELPGAQAEVLAALQAGPLAPREVAALLGKSNGAAKFLLATLKAGGHVERLPDGTYRPSRACEVGE